MTWGGVKHSGAHTSPPRIPHLPFSHHFLKSSCCLLGVEVQPHIGPYCRCPVGEPASLGEKGIEVSPFSSAETTVGMCAGFSVRPKFSRLFGWEKQIFLAAFVCACWWLQVGSSCQLIPIWGYVRDNKEAYGTYWHVVSQVLRSLGNPSISFYLSKSSYTCLFCLCPEFFSWPLFLSEP